MDQTTQLYLRFQSIFRYLVFGLSAVFFFSAFAACWATVVHKQILMDSLDNNQTKGLTCCFCWAELTATYEEVVPLHGNNWTETVSLIKCHKCNKYGAVCLDGLWMSLKQALWDANLDQTVITQVKSLRDRVILFLLCQVFHNLLDLANDEADDNGCLSPFLPHPPSEFARIIWSSNQAVGFYSVKLKGSPFYQMAQESYALPVLDTVYVRTEFRRRGLGLRLIQDFVEQFPHQDVGFSEPVSDGLYRVLAVFLRQTPATQGLLWECGHTGEEGYRRNIWFHLKRCRSLGKMTGFSRVN